MESYTSGDIKESVFFTSFELSKDKIYHRWHPDLIVVEDAATKPSHGLILKKTIIGKNAKPGELNLVEVTTQNAMGKYVNVTLSFLGYGADFPFDLNITLPDGVVEFHLVQGEGPVHILAQHVVRTPQLDDSDDQEETDAYDSEVDTSSKSDEHVEDENWDKEDDELMNVDMENPDN